MKTTCLSLFIAAGLFTSGTSLADEALAKAKGCLACHTVDKKLIGPTYKEIAQKYAGQKDAEARMIAAITKGTPVPAGRRKAKRRFRSCRPTRQSSRTRRPSSPSGSSA